MKNYILEVLIAIEQLINAVCFGWADETLSARCWRLRKRYPFKIFRPIIDTLFFFQKNHCKEAFYSEKERKQSPIAER